MPEANPWRVLSADVRYDNRWITVTHHDVLTPSGTPGLYGVVHFKHHAVGIVVLDGERNTWLVGQQRFPLDRYSWEIPEGGGDAGGRLESAKRELREETGIEAATWRVLFEDLALSNSVTDEVATIYLATSLTCGEASPDETERLQLRKLPFEEAVAMALDGRITDIMSVVAILKVRLMQLEGEL
jgi:ADP-ribose pyrophosphatase